MFAAEGGDLRLRQPPTPPNKVKLADLQAALEPMVLAIDRAIRDADPPNSSENVYHYFRQFGGIFCGMSTNGNFTPEYLVSQIPVSPLGQDPLVHSSYMLEVKEVIVGLYRIAYRDRIRAELPAVEWIVKIADTFCETVDRGIKKTGKQGIK